jgi:hypothetical protein
MWYVYIVIYYIPHPAEVKLAIKFSEREGRRIGKLTSRYGRFYFFNVVNNLNRGVCDSVTAGTW